MSRVVERLLPPLRDHLGGPLAFHTTAAAVPPSSPVERFLYNNNNSKGGNGSSKKRVAFAELEDAPQRAGYSGNSNSSSSGSSGVSAARERTLAESYRRWQHCFAVWRKVIGNDVLLLALLHHSGCLWSPQYGPLKRAARRVKEDWQAAQRGGEDPGVPKAFTAAVLLQELGRRRPFDLWALHVLNFLNLVELFEEEVEGPEDADGADSSKGGMNHSRALSHSAPEPDSEDPTASPTTTRSRESERHHGHRSHSHNRSSHRDRSRRRRSRGDDNDDEKRQRHRRSRSQRHKSEEKERHRSRERQHSRHSTRSRSRHRTSNGKSSSSDGSGGGRPTVRLECSVAILQDLLPAPLSLAATLGPAAASPTVVAALSSMGDGAGGGRGGRKAYSATTSSGGAGGGGGGLYGYGYGSPTSNPLSPHSFLTTSPTVAAGVSYAPSTPAAAAAAKEIPVACSISAESQQQLLCKALVSVTYADEPLVQLTATWLVEEWLALLSYDSSSSATELTAANGIGCSSSSTSHPPASSLCALRNYWFASAVKLAAYVDGTHTALLEENAHVQAILARQSLSPTAAAELFQRSIPAILCCLLRDEVSHSGADEAAFEPGLLSLADDAEEGGDGRTLLPRPLFLPPLVYFIPLQTIARGSRVAVWVPSALPPTGRVAASPAAAATASSTSSSSSRKRSRSREKAVANGRSSLPYAAPPPPSSPARPGVEWGEFLLFEVASDGASLGGSSSIGGLPSAAAFPATAATALSFGLRWVDEGSAAGGSCGWGSRRSRGRNSSRPASGGEGRGRSRHGLGATDDGELLAVVNQLLPHVPEAETEGEEHGWASVDGGRGVRLWSAAQESLQGHLRVDMYAHRVLFMRPLPARDPGRQEERDQTQHKGPSAATAPCVAGKTAPNTKGADEQHRKRRGAGGGGQPDVLLTLLSGVYSASTSEVLATLQRRLRSSKIVLSHQRGIGGAGGAGASGRLTLARDPLGTVLLFLHLTARRVIALGGCCVATPRPRPSRRSGEGKAAPPPLPPPPPDVVDATATTAAAFAKGPPATNAAPWLTWSFASRATELRALVECALTLSLLALTHAHNLLDTLREQQSAALWLTEVASFVADLAVATNAPVRRFLRAAGFALCLLPPRSQSVLVAVGLYAALGTRQLHSMMGNGRVPAHSGRRGGATREGGGDEGPSRADDALCLWWSAYSAAVLADPYVPAQLHPTTWALADSVERSLQNAITPSASPAYAGVCCGAAVVHDADGGGNDDDAASVATARTAVVRAAASLWTSLVQSLRIFFASPTPPATAAAQGERTKLLGSEGEREGGHVESPVS